MKVITGTGAEIDLGTVETTPTISIIDYSRRETDDFGVTTVVERGFARRLSVRLAIPTEDVDAVQQQLAALRAESAQWVADDRYDWLNVDGFYKDFDLDLATPTISYCTLNVEGLAETEVVADAGRDPAPIGSASTLRLLQPVVITDAILTASNAPENDYAEWAAGTTYALGARVIKAALHRIFESAAAGNIGHDPAALDGHWIDVGPTNRWAMFDQALGSATAKASPLTVTLAPGAVNAVALLDVTGATVRVQIGGYDETKAVGAGAVTFLDVPATGGAITVTVAGAGAVSVGTLLVGTLVSLGITEASPTAGISDFSRKDVDDFGEVAIVPRSWAKRMSARALISSDAVDVVANRIATVRARPSLWIADEGTDSLTVYGFFKDFSLQVGETVSTLSLSVEGLSEADNPQPLAVTDLAGSGALAAQDYVWFGTGGTIKEAIDGADATLPAFKTDQGTAAGIAGQGSGATANNLTQLNPTEGTKLGTIATGATVGAVASTNLYRSDGSTVLTQAEVRTSEGTAAAISGQGAFATLNSAAYGSSLLTGFGTIAGRNNVRIGTELVRADGISTTSDAALVTSLGTAAAISGQGSYATVSQTYFGDGLLKETSGGATALLSNFKTSLGTASAISGQGALATKSSVAYGTTDVSGFGTLAGRANVRLGTEVVRADGTTPATETLVVTAFGTAAAIAGQGALATKSTADFAADVSGIKPVPNAGSSLSLTVTAGAPTIQGNNVTFTAAGQRAVSQTLLGPCRVTFKKTGGPGVSLMDAAGNFIQLVLHSGQVRLFTNAGQIGGAYTGGLTGNETFWLVFDGVTWYSGWDGSIFFSGGAPSGNAIHAQLDYFEAAGDSVYDIQFEAFGLRPRSGSTLEKSDGSIFTDAMVQTSLGTAAAIAGQGALATKSSVAYGTGDVSGFGTLAARANVRIGAELVRADGVTATSDASLVTSLGTAAAISGQGALATKSTVTYGTGDVSGFGTLAARANVRFGTEVVRADGSTVATDAMVVTSLGTAAAISGQGSGATANNLTQLNSAEGGKLGGIAAGAGADVVPIPNGTNSVTVVGNSFKSNVASANYESQVRGQFRTGAQVAECDIPAADWAIVAFSTAIAGTDYTLQLAYASYNSATGVVGLYSNGAQQVLTNVGAGITGKAALEYTGTAFVWRVGGAEVARFSTTPGQTLVPKWTIYNSLQTVTGLLHRPLNDVTIYRDNGTTRMVQSEVRTAEGTAAAIAGQGALATANYSYYGTGGTIKEAFGGADATLGNFKTSLGTAAAITGQGALATKSTANLGADVTGRLPGADYMFPAFVAGVRNTNSVALTAVDAGATATINVPAHSRKSPGASGQISVSYNSGSITGLAFSTTYFVYCDDPTYAGGAVTYQATANSDDLTAVAARIAVGSITTPADGGGGTGGTGGVGGGFGGGGGYINP